MLTEDRFWNKVDKTDTCWLWTAALRVGYGGFWDGNRHTYAHRYAWELLRGPIPAGYTIDHDNPDFGCGVPLCVNPAHLDCVPHKTNIQRRRNTNSNNKSGTRNIRWRTGKWVVQVGHLGVSHYGGRFDDLAEAERAAAALREKVFS